MIVIKLRLLNSILIIFLLTTSTIIVDAAAGRCYLCSQNTLAECVGSIQPNSPLFTTVLRYYTEPCNGQCILFRNEKTSTVRGCSWTYGHMTSKSTGWHELSPGIQAYFCDSYLCNNGTLEQPEPVMPREGIINDEFILPPPQTFTLQTLTPQQLFIMAGNAPSVIPTDQQLPPINDISHQLRQCYSCTARLNGCGEYLDPHYASKYIRPCTSSCIIFRNPSDHNFITRDCSTSWPQVHAKSGLHKLLGSDAFFCQESLCNGISFDFIMGIFHNQLPAVITFSPTEIIEDISTTIIRTTTTTSVTHSITTAMSIDDDNVIWEDPDLDFLVVEPATTIISTTSTSLPLPTEFPEDTDDLYESSTIPPESVEHFDFIEKIPASSTIAGGLAVAEQDSQFQWWELDETLFPSLTQPNIPLLTSTIATNTFTLIPSTIKSTNIDEDEWEIFNTSVIPSVTQVEHLSDSNSEIDFDMNDYFLFPTLSTTPSMDLIKNFTPPLVPFYLNNDKTKDQLLGLIKPGSSLAIPPFSWMLQLANQNKNELKGRQSLINKSLTTISSTMTTKKQNKKKRLDLKKTLNNNYDHFYEYCNKKQCQNGGRLNSDCLCICMPAFNGHNCQIVNCNEEPAHICDFALEHECKSDYVRYLCPKFCQMNICSPNKSSRKHQ